MSVMEVIVAFNQFLLEWAMKLDNEQEGKGLAFWQACNEGQIYFDAMENDPKNWIIKNA